MINRGTLPYSKVHEQEFNTNFSDTTYTIELHKQATQAAQTLPLTLTGDPLYINMLSSGDELTDKIKPHEFVLNLNSIEDMKWLKLLVTSNFDWQIRIRRSGVLIHVGYIVPDIYNEVYTTPPYPVSMSFICGLAMLKDIPFADENGCYWRGFHSGIKIIAFCLSQLRNSINIADCINIISDKASTFESYLANHFWDVELFKGLTCYETIERILPEGVRIFQRSNRWEIAPFDQLEYTGFIFNREGNPTGATLTNETIVALTNARAPIANRAVWTDQSQQLEICPGWRNFTLTHIFGKKESMLPAFEFNECDFVGNIPRGWTGQNIRRAEVEEKSVLELRATTFGDPCFALANLGTYTFNGKDRFRLTVDSQIGTYNARDGRQFIWYSPNSNRNTGFAFFELEYIEDTNGTWEAIGLTTLNVSRGFNHVIFNNISPTDLASMSIKTGYIYVAENVTTAFGNVRFSLLEGPGANPLKIGSGQQGRRFSVLIGRNFTRNELRVGNSYADQNNIWSLRSRLNLELNQSDFSNKRFFTQSWTSILAPDTGTLQFRLQKPLPETSSGGLYGSMFIEKAILEIIDTPTKKKYEVLINDKFNIRDKKIDVYYGPIRDTTTPSATLELTRIEANQPASVTILFRKNGVNDSKTLNFDPVNISESASRAVFFYNQSPAFGVIFAKSLGGSGQTVSIQFTDRTGEVISQDGISVTNFTFTGTTDFGTIVIDPNQALKYYGAVKYQNTQFIEKHKLRTYNPDTNEYELSDEKDLPEIYSKLYKNLRSRARYKLSGSLNVNPTIQGNVQGKLLYDQFSERYFSLIEYIYSVKNDTFTLTSEEVLYAPGGEIQPGDFNEDYNEDYLI